ncbi:MAG TPA: 3'(2'),5'-bisphosphate nucleotidase CysQ [Kofleriaceae bacterium]|nr:3'(2'),5'-bisphosphate nucleotidase CysQ [Kofleriaceae bacterium]
MKAWERELAAARRLAIEAGKLALRYREGDLKVELKAGDEPVTIADRAASRLIVDGLVAEFPDDVVISEETEDDLRRLQAQRVWYIDPIDGTKDFIRGEDGFCVMIGLTVGHRPLVGAIYQPAGDRLYWAAPGRGAWAELPGQPPRAIAVSAVDRIEDIRFVASKSHRGGEIDQVKGALGIRNEVNVGSVGLKLALIALGERDLYVNPYPKCKTWDTCAPEALLVEAGGLMTDVHGQPLSYASQTCDRPHGMVATNGKVHAAVIEKLAPVFAGR